MNAINIEELGKSIAYLLESLTDILSAGGPPFSPARDDLQKLLRSKKLLNSDAVKRHAFNLSNMVEEILDRVGHGAVEIRLADDHLAASVEAGGLSLVGDSPGLMLEIIKHVVSFRPQFYQDQVQDLEALIESEATVEEILRKLADLILQIRLDFWDERSKAFKHIEDILKSLEATERDFISSLGTNHDFVKDSNQAFTSTMEEGLKDIGSLVTPGKYDLEELCLILSQKVGQLQECVQKKKRDDQYQMEVLDTEQEGAEKRLIRNQRDYEEFNRQSHEMLQEIENLRAISLRDPLTEIYNRRADDNQIVKTLAAFKVGALKTCSLIIFDIDNFREFNNTYGHLAGDRVLSYVAKLTKDTLRRDDLIFRYGGDEFVILIPNASLEAAMGVAEKVRRHITSVEFKLFKSSDVTVKVTVSMGVSEVKEDDDTTSFFARADQAMFKSKNAGRNRVSSSF